MPVLVGNTRLVMKDRSIWATILDSSESDYILIYDCPLADDFNNIADNDYELSLKTNGSCSGGCYTGGLLTARNVYLDLTKEWKVTFEYAYTGETTPSVTAHDTTTLAANWNYIFAFGSHQEDPGSDGTDNIEAGLLLGYLNDVSGLNVRFWYNQVSLTKGLWHYYEISHSGDTTTVSVDNQTVTSNQYTYNSSVNGFFFSGGGYAHSLPSKIKNFRLYGVLAEESQ